MKSLAPLALLFAFLLILAGTAHYARTPRPPSDGTREILVDDEPKRLAVREIVAELETMVGDQLERVGEE